VFSYYLGQTSRSDEGTQSKSKSRYFPTNLSNPVSYMIFFREEEVIHLLCYFRNVDILLRSSFNDAVTTANYADLIVG
jgi:hypothetical protein